MAPKRPHAASMIAGLGAAQKARKTRHENSSDSDGKTSAGMSSNEHFDSKISDEPAQATGSIQTARRSARLAASIEQIAGPSERNTPRQDTALDAREKNIPVQHANNPSTLVNQQISAIELQSLTYFHKRIPGIAKNLSDIVDKLYDRLLSEPAIKNIADLNQQAVALQIALKSQSITVNDPEQWNWVLQQRKNVAKNTVKVRFAYRPVTLASDNASENVNAICKSWLEKIPLDMIPDAKANILKLPESSFVLENSLNVSCLHWYYRYVCAEFIATFLSCAPDIDFHTNTLWKDCIWNYVNNQNEIVKFRNSLSFDKPITAVILGARISNLKLHVNLQKKFLETNAVEYNSILTMHKKMIGTMPDIAAAAYLRCHFDDAINQEPDTSAFMSKYERYYERYALDTKLLLPELKYVAETKAIQLESKDTWLRRTSFPTGRHNVSAPVSFENEYQDVANVPHALTNYVHYVHTVFKETNESDDGYIYPVFPVVQSSGWGKTRLAYEMRDKVSCIYICLRAFEESTGFPKRSPEIAKHIFGLSKVESYQNVLLRILITFYALVRYSDPNGNVAKIASTLMKLSFLTNTSIESDNDMATLRTSNAGGNPLLSAQSLWEFVLGNHLADFARGILANDIFSPAEINEAVKSLSLHPISRDLIKKIITATQNHWSNHSPNIPTHAAFPLAIVFDEASSLLPAKSGKINNSFSDSEMTRYYSFRKAVANLGDAFVAVLIDTDGRISNYAPPSIMDGSSRTCKGNRLFHPFFSLPSPPAMPLHEKLAEFLLVAKDGTNGRRVCFNPFEMVAKSRPLFMGMSEYYLSGRDNVIHSCRYIWNQLVNLAQNKITLCKDTEAFKLTAEFRILAIFAARFPIIPLDQRIGQDMVASAMATLLSLNEERSFAHIAYVPEPMVALGAMKVMSIPEVFSKHLALFMRMIVAGKVGALVNLGDFGELVASIVIARAYDAARPSPHAAVAAVCAQGSSEPAGNVPKSVAIPVDHTGLPNLTGELSYHGTITSSIQAFADFQICWPVTLRSFLNQLLRTTHIGKIDAALRKSPHLCELVDGGWMWPMQFSHLPRELDGDDGILLDAWSRRIAIVTSSNQKGCDIIVPIMIPGSTGNRLTALFFEVKCITRPIPKTQMNEIVSNLCKTARLLVPSGPVACMVLQLGSGGIAFRNNENDRVWINRVSVEANAQTSSSDSSLGPSTPTSVQEDMCSLDPEAQSADMSQISDDMDSVSFGRVYKDILLITAHTLDHETFGDFMSSTDFECMRDLVDKPGKLMHEIRNVMPSYGYDEQSAKSAIAMMYRGYEPNALRRPSVDVIPSVSNEIRVARANSVINTVKVTRAHDVLPLLE